MKRDQQFKNTLAEIKSDYSYNTISTPSKLFVKNGDYHKFSNYKPSTDYHGLVWEDRTVLDVVSVDYSAGKIAVRNCNGLEWIMDLSLVIFCTQNGDRIK